MDQFIVRRSQKRMPGLAAKPVSVDHALRMLDAESHGKRLGLEIDPPPVQHLEGIPGAVAHRQDDVLRRQDLPAFQNDAPKLPVLDHQVIHPGLKPNLRPQPQKLGPHGFHHFDQTERPHVGFVDVENLRRRPRLDEFFENLPGSVSPGP